MEKQKGKYIGLGITEHKGKIDGTMNYVEYRCYGDKRIILSQNKCVFEVHPGSKGQVKTIGCYKSESKANKVAREKAIEILG